MRKMIFSLVLGLACLLGSTAFAADVPTTPANSSATETAAAPTAEDISGVGDAEAALQDLFETPIEVDGCCHAQCFGEYEVCRQGCGSYSDPGFFTCLNQCRAARDQCLSHC